MADEKEQIFTDELFKIYSNKCDRLLMPKEKLSTIINRLVILCDSSTTKKTREDYNLISRFEVLQLGSLEKLIKKRNEEEDPIIYFVSLEETYDVIKKAHVAINHAGRDKMQKELNKKYANVTLYAINLYKSMCEECQLRRKNPAKGVVVKPILSKEFNSRGQVDLIDMQSMPDGNFKFIMNYQDHLTKFCTIECLSSKRAAEVAYKLLTNVFLVFGAPHILQSDNGREFTANIICELKQLWPELVIVHGKPRHPQFQGSERSNGDIHDMLMSWMRDNETTKWATGIKFVQFQKNRRSHSGIKRSPYEAMFGCQPKVGLASSPILTEMLATLQQEEDLNFELTNRHRLTSVQSSNQDLSSHVQQVTFPIRSLVVSVGDNPTTDNQSEPTETPHPATHVETTDTSSNLQQTSVNPDIQIVYETTNIQLASDTFDSQSTSEKDDNQQASEIEASLIDILIPQTQNESVTEHAVNDIQSLQYERECNKCSSFFQTDLTLQMCCDICMRSESIQRERHASGSNLSKQAEKMVARSNQILRPVQVGDNVTVPIPSVDRGRGDPRNILCLVLEHDVTSDQFKLCSKNGILNGSFSRNQFTYSAIHSLTLQDANTQVELSVREAGRLQSVGDGQGFLKCACKTGCVRKTCKCVKANILCNSRCHNSLSCHNK